MKHENSFSLNVANFAYLECSFAVNDLAKASKNN